MNYIDSEAVAYFKKHPDISPVDKAHFYFGHLEDRLIHHFGHSDRKLKKNLPLMSGQALIYEVWRLRKIIEEAKAENAALTAALSKEPTT